MNLSTFAQNTVDLSLETQQVDIGKSLYYFEDVNNSLTPETVLNQKFSPQPNTYFGKQSVKIWYQLKLRNTSLEKLKFICRIHTISFDYLKFYKEENGILKEIYHYKDLQNKNIEFPFYLSAKNEVVVYAEVFFKKSVYFPVKIASISQNETINRTLKTVVGIFLGAVFIVLCINFFFYSTTKKRFFLSYCFLLISTTLILFELDNGFYLLFGNTQYIEHVALFLHIALAISVMLFTEDAVGVKKYYPKIVFVAGALVFINMVCYAMYIATNELFWYSNGVTVNILILLLYEIVAILLYKKEVYARFIVMGYSVFLLFSLLYDLTVQYGVIDLGVTEWVLKIGAFIEMIVFMYALSYRHKQTLQEKATIHDRLAKEFKSQKLLREDNIEQQNKLIAITTALETKKLQLENTYVDFIQKFELTPRESEIGKLLLKGYSNKEISEKLHLKIATIKYHIANIFIKLDITKRIDFLNSFLNYVKKNSL